jgi:nicotinamidase-related amidase
MRVYLVLDLINDIVHRDGAHGAAGFGPEARRRRVLESTARALEKARAAGARVGYVRVGFSPDYRECPPNSPRFAKARANGRFKLGTWATEVHEAVRPRPEDFDIVKHRVSPFYGTTLEPILRANAIRRLYVSGVSTNAVVQSAVREGHDRDYEMVLIENGCSALTPEEHAAAVDLLRGFCTVTTSETVTFRDD